MHFHSFFNFGQIFSSSFGYFRSAFGRIDFTINFDNIENCIPNLFPCYFQNTELLAISHFSQNLIASIKFVRPIINSISHSILKTAKNQTFPILSGFS